jgi:predicted RNase H-like HicB family nuclease
LGTIAQRSVMQYQIFVQNPAEQRFTASVLGFVPTCVAEGRTKDEALTALQQVVEERLASGEIVTVNWPQPQGEVPHAALLGNGMFKDDPTFDDFLERMAEYREKVNRQEFEQA